MSLSAKRKNKVNSSTYVYTDIETQSLTHIDQHTTQEKNPVECDEVDDEEKKWKH